MTASKIPRDLWPDSTVLLLREGYRFIPERCRRYKSDIFQTRLLLRKTICISGAEAAKLFYNTEKFQRKRAVPRRIQKTLFGENGVQGMDGTMHRNRKDMFMTLMAPARLAELNALMTREWLNAVLKWKDKNEIILLEECREILCRAICSWSGITLKEEEVRTRTEDLAAIVDGFSAIGPRYWQARQARLRCEAWIGEIMTRIRNGTLKADEKTAAYAFAWRRDLTGHLLDIRTATVEVLNVLRPTVAVSYYIAFAALALHQYPDSRKKIAGGDDEFMQRFIQEVRRFYPFAPFLGARARIPFEWRGHEFQPGQLVLLDLYGTNHDPRLWEEPEKFDPQRFKDNIMTPFNFMPQGGGDPHAGHRCAGEQITVQAMKVAITYLTRSMTYDVPEQDLAYSLSRMPSILPGGFVMSNIRAATPESVPETLRQNSG